MLRRLPRGESWQKPHAKSDRQLLGTCISGADVVGDTTLKVRRPAESPHSSLPLALTSEANLRWHRLLEVLHRVNPIALKAFTCRHDGLDKALHVGA